MNGHLFDINQNDFTLALKHCEKLLNKKKYISDIFFKKYNIDLLIDEYYSIYTNKKPINILAIDIEGGWGGSSKSLYNLINKSISPKKNFIVVCKALGPIYIKYKDIKASVKKVADKLKELYKKDKKDNKLQELTNIHPGY